MSATSEVAPWAKDASRALSWSLPLRLLVCTLIPPTIVAAAVWCGYWHIVITVLVILTFTVFFNAVDRIVSKHPTLVQVKIVGPALELAAGFRAYYMEHRPRIFFFYLFYPLCALFGAPFSASIRREALLYLRVFVALIMVVLVQTALSYGSTYPPYLTWKDALVILVVEVFLTLYMCVVYLMPMVSTAYSLSLAGKHVSLRILVASSLLLSLPGGYFGFWLRSHQVNPVSGSLLNRRIRKPAFRADLREATVMFLSYYSKTIRPSASTTAPKNEPALIEKYRRTIDGITVRDEKYAFYVFSMLDSEVTRDRFWLGVSGQRGKLAQVLYVIGPDGDFYSSWKALPPSIRTRFPPPVPQQMADELPLETSN